MKTCTLVEMKDSLEKHESGHQLADYRIMETQVFAIVCYYFYCSMPLCEVVYTVFSTFSEVQECHG